MTFCDFKCTKYLCQKMRVLTVKKCSNVYLGRPVCDNKVVKFRFKLWCHYVKQRRSLFVIT